MICMAKIEAVNYVGGLPGFDLVDGARIVDIADRFGEKQERYQGGKIVVRLCCELAHLHRFRAFEISRQDD